MRSVLIALVVGLLLALSPAAAVSCGTNGECVATASCPNWASAVADAACTAGQVCCQSPSCTSSLGEVGLCKVSTCSSGRSELGQCADASVPCCLPSAQPEQCQSNGVFGSCSAKASCSTGNTVDGLCSDSTQTCCLPNSGQETCFAQQMSGVCQSSSTTCASGNTVGGLCSSSSNVCCLPQAASTISGVGTKCSTSLSEGVCQLGGSSCTSGNVVQGLCSNSLQCCLDKPVSTATTCTAQGQSGMCQTKDSCATSGGVSVAGLCPGDSNTQCCLPRGLNYGTCLTPEGYVGNCQSSACSGTNYGADLCTGGSDVQCCVTSFAPPAPVPEPDYGKCSFQGQVGTCKDSAKCTSATSPVAGLCGGPANIACCLDAANNAQAVFSPPRPVDFFGACASAGSSNGAGTCRNATQCASEGFQPEDFNCPTGAPSHVKCCPDGGPSYIPSVDLPGGRGVELSSTIVGSSLNANLLTCLKNNNAVTFASVRGWTATCTADSKLSTTLTLAASNGLAADVFMVPAFWCGLTAQIQASSLIGALQGLTFGRVWIRISDSTASPSQGGSGWTTSIKANNLAWLEEAAQALVAAFGSARVGIQTSAAAWNTVMGSASAGSSSPILSGLALSLQGGVEQQTMKDTIAFGPFRFATVKQVASQTLCGITTNALWLPTRSSTTINGAPAPVDGSLGACSVDGFSGECRRASSCSATLIQTDSCTALDKGAACCLPQYTPPPAPVTPNATSFLTYGLCLSGQQTGVCKPSVNCLAADGETKNTTAGLCPDAGAGDADVICCLPPASSPITPPPNDTPASASAAAVANFAVRSFYTSEAVPVPSNLASKAATTASQNANVCINKAGLALIESFEGFFPNFYNDAVGIKTIGFGTACHAYPCDTLRPPLTRAQAEAVMLSDLNAHYAPCIRNWIKVPLNSNQFSALAAFIYNVGCGALQGTTVAKNLNAGCYSCVKANLGAWNKAGGKVLNGLTRRRTAEGDLFNNANISPCLDGSSSVASSSSTSGQSWGSCTFNGKSGDCIDSANCEGTTVSGLCSGPSNVKCCVGSTPNPAPVAANACGNGGTCKSTSQCNTASNTLVSGLCPGAADIKCCVPKSKIFQSKATDGWWSQATRDELSAGSAFVDTDPITKLKTAYKIVLHTTEGGSYEGARASYSGTHPHFTVTFQRGFFQAYQHVSILVSAKALKHPYNTVHTNLAKAIQIEIVGSATKSSSFDQKYLDGIASLLRWIESVHGIPKRAPKFLAYPASAGNSAVRFKAAEWVTFSGTCGHQHVPQNEHGDPGTININYLLGSNGQIWQGGSSDTTSAGVNGNPGDFGKCTSAGRTGVCQDKGSCSGTVVSGLCSGPSNVACCLENYGSCTVPASGSTPALLGQCVESSTCNGATYSGLCAGPSSVKCCVPDYGTCKSGASSGKCQQINTCTGTVVKGLCTGPDNIGCCLPAKPVDYGSCSVNYAGTSVTGQCISKSSCAAPFVSASGLCPGPADIGCCHNPTTVRTYTSCGTNGKCQDVSTCTGTVKRGLCPGASNIACCEYPTKAKTAKVAASSPLNSPRALFAPTQLVNDTVVYGDSTKPYWTSDKLTLCSAGGQQGFCFDGSVGGSVCNGVVTYPSTCGGSSSCCTPSPCTITNTTTGICIPPQECKNMAGYVTPGLCGVNGGADGITSCCSGIGQAQCDTDGLLQCLLADGDAVTCATSFNCPPLPDYNIFSAQLQQTALAGIMPHANFTNATDVQPSNDNGSGGGLTAAAHATVSTATTVILAAIAVCISFIARQL